MNLNKETVWPDRRLIELFQVEHPLVLAPMAGIGTVELAASVCAAGGLGSIGCAGMKPEVATKTIQALRVLTDKPINVNFFCHIQAEADAACEKAWRDRLSPTIASLGLSMSCCTPAWIWHRSMTQCAGSSRIPNRKW